jgi:3-deoxy-D-manno-octulosonic-acid transferase
LTVAKHSCDETITNKTDIYLIDTIGDMGLAYSLSGITLVCGSLIKGLKGHNPLEPANFSNAILTGNYFNSFQDIYMSMINLKAAAKDIIS